MSADKKNVARKKKTITENIDDTEEFVSLDDSSETIHDEEHVYEDWDEFLDEHEDVSRLSKKLEHLIPGVVKRGVVAGIGSLMSEDGIRSLVAEKKLPKEAVGYLLNSADATKKEFLRIISKEIRDFLENVDLGGELTKILTSVSFEVKTEVRFIPNDAAVKPSVKNRVKVKKTSSDRVDDDISPSPLSSDDGR